MSIISAQIEANGWVLRIVHTQGLGNFASYTLDPDGSPRLTLGSSHPGFVQSGGQAVAGAAARTLVGTKPLRKPVKWNGPASTDIDPPTIDEVNLGGGQTQVRIALSNFVYATDTGLSLSVAANWRAGEAAASGIAVTNGSTVAAPIPIFRWADVPYQRQTGPFEVGIVCFSHHPNGLAPVAAVKFTVTDGTNTKTVWTTALGTSVKYGDQLRGYFVTLDPTAAPALNAGLLRIDCEIYPWLGSMRPSDTAGTRSMAGLTTAGHGTAAASPFTVAWDPSGTRYAPGYVAIDPVSGTTTAAAAMVQPTLAAAKALAATAKPKDWQTAIQAGYLLNRTLAAANGQGAQTRSVDGLNIVVPAGAAVANLNGTVTSGVTANETWVNIVGDPDNASPRSACIVRTGTANGNSRIGKLRLANLSIEQGSFYLVSSAYVWTDNVERRGQTGLETNTTTFTSGLNLAVYATRSRVWKCGNGFKQASSQFPHLVRNCEVSRNVAAMAVLGLTWIKTLDSFAPANDACLSDWSSNLTDLGSHEDIIRINCDLRGITYTAVIDNGADGPTKGVGTVSSFQRQVFANNICERKDASGQPFWAHDELTVTGTRAYNIYEGNTFVGERCNSLYNRPLVASLADIATLQNANTCNRMANNSFDWYPSKHDDVFEPTIASLRGNNNGYGEIRVACWCSLYGVMFEGNYDWARTGINNFQVQYFGRGSYQTPSGSGVPNWALDASVLGTNAGGGNYRPPAGSPLIGRATSANLDRDITGAVRSLPFSTGALDTPGAVTVSPSAARSATRAATPAVTLQLALAPAKARSASRAAAAALAWTTALTPAKARSAGRASAPGLAWTAQLGPAAAAHAQRGGSAPLAFAPLLAPGSDALVFRTASPVLDFLADALIEPGDGWNACHAGDAVLFPAASLTRLRTLKVYADPRTAAAGD